MPLPPPPPSGRWPAPVPLFALACGLCVANVYAVQPLLDLIAHDLGWPSGRAGWLVGATQAGSVLALLVLLVLGDRLDRRRLALAQLAALSGALLAVSFARCAAMLLPALGAVGLLGTAMTQGLLAHAAQWAAPGQRGRVVGAAQGGVVTGLLLARGAAGLLSDLAGWRAVYLVSGAAMLVLMALLWWALPAVRRPAPAAPVPPLWHWLRHDRVLRVRGMLGLFLFMAFGIFWSALVLPLAAPPWSMSHAAIGAFGLVGAAGALAAARAGRWADRGWGERTSHAALWLMLAAWLPLAGLGHSIAWLVPGILLLDLGVQALHVSNQSLILAGRPEAAGRLIGAYMVFYAVGSGAGAVIGTQAHAWAGWPGVCGAGAAASALALVFWRVTLPCAARAARPATP